MSKTADNISFVFSVNFVKEQLQQFFPRGNGSCAPMHEIRKNNHEIPNVSNQSLDCGSSPVMRKIVDRHESCDLLHRPKRKVRKFRRGSPHTQAPRRSPRLAQLKNTSNRTDNMLEERSEVLDPSPAPENQVKEQDGVLKGVHDEVIGRSEMLQVRTTF
jgi:hypothetical protein